MFKKWFWNVLIALDQLVNALAFGDPDETISSRAAKAMQEGKRSNLTRERAQSYPTDASHTSRLRAAFSLDDRWISTFSTAG
jgi:hypothetical protein